MPKLTTGDTVRFVPTKTYPGEPADLDVPARIVTVHPDSTLDLHVLHPSVKGGIAHAVAESADRAAGTWHRA